MGKSIITNTSMGHSLLILGSALAVGTDASDNFSEVKKYTGHSFE